MAYNPMTYMPQAYQPYQAGPAAPISQPNQGWGYQQPVNGLVSVTGEEGAKAYQLPPNSSMPLFDADKDVMYVKTTDAGGFPTIRAFRFEPIENEAAEPTQEYVTREDFDALMAKVDALQPKKPTRTAKKEATDGE